MTVLEEIVANKREELKVRKAEVSLSDLMKAPYYKSPCVPVIAKQGLPFIITEFKRRSPSNPDINLTADVKEVISRYEARGASAISVLTDSKYFGGSLADLQSVRSNTKLPILRKDFVVDAFQVHEAKAFGADIILLIAASLSKVEMQELFDLAKEIGLEVLVELHDASELSLIPDGARLVGVNSRNLKTLETDKQKFFDMYNALPADTIKVAESAIKSSKEINELMETGYAAFLIGEAFMNRTFEMEQK